MIMICVQLPFATKKVLTFKICSEKKRNKQTQLALVFLLKKEPVHAISNNVVCATSKASDQPAHTRSLIRAFASRLNIL